MATDVTVPPLSSAALVPEKDRYLLAMALLRTRVSYFTPEERVRLTRLMLELTGYSPKDGRVI